MDKSQHGKEAKSPSVPWLALVLLGPLLWLGFGSVPLLIYWLGIIDNEKLQYLGTIGDTFGAANALFSGLAFIAVAITLRQQQHALFLQHIELKLTRKELKDSAEAQQEIAKHQNNAISLQVILPLMDEIGSEDMRKARIRVSDFKRHHDECEFINYYTTLLKKRRANELSDEETQELDEIDSARRRFVFIFHKLHRLNKSGVIGNNIVKVVVGPDAVDLLLETVEKLEAAIAPNYSQEIFDLARQLYTDEERQWGRY